MQHWKLPQPIQDAVGRHHDPDTAVPASAKEIPLWMILSVADHCVNSMGLSIFESKIASGSEPDLQRLENLGLARTKAEKITKDFAREFETTAQFFR